MTEWVLYLNRRRLYMFSVIILSMIIAIIVDYNFTIEKPTYFEGKYNMQIVYFLILYKLIELPILYYLLFHRYVSQVIRKINNKESFVKLKKHTKLLFFLIPQGNIVFGVISYKVSGEISYFFIFTIIAIIALFMTKPNRFLQYNN
ncbi:hypothetical protein N9A28_03390 [Sulfurimonas sp.]|nr:hypothetical protein [Sulfurimonas sp.]